MIKLIMLRIHLKHSSDKYWFSYVEVFKQRYLIMYNVLQVYRILCYAIWFEIKSITMISFVWISKLLLKFGLEINRF